MRYTRSKLKKLEELCLQLGYKVRYEQGHFQSGYCRVEAKRILVINKFFDIEGRINCLIDLMPELPVNVDQLDDETRSVYEKALQFKQEDSEIIEA